MYYAWHPVWLPCSPAEAVGPGGGGGGAAPGGQIRWRLQRRAAQPVLSGASQQLEMHRQRRQQHGQPQPQDGNGGQAGPAVRGLQLPQVMLSQSQWSEEVADAVNAQGGLNMEEMMAYSEMSGGLVSGASGAASDVLFDALQREIGVRKRLQRELLRYQLQEQAQQAQRGQQPQPAPPQQRQQRQAQAPQQAAAPQHRQQRQALPQQQQLPQQQAAPQLRQQRQAQQPAVQAQQPRAAQQPQQARRRPEAGAAAAAAAGGGGHRPRQAPRPPGGLQQPRQHARQQAQQQQPRRQQHEQWQGQGGLPPQQDWGQGGGEASGMTDAPEPQAPQQRAAAACSLVCTAGGPDASELQPPAHAGKRRRPADSQAERQHRRLRQHPQPQHSHRSEEGSVDLHSRQGSAGSTPARQQEPFARAGSSEQELAVSCAVGGGSQSAAILCEAPVPLVAAEAAAELEAAEAAAAASEAAAQRETAEPAAELEAEDATEAAAAGDAAAQPARKQQAPRRRSARGLVVQQPAPAAVQPALPDAQPAPAAKAAPAARRRPKAAAAAARRAAAAAAAAEPAAAEAEAPAAPANPQDQSAHAEATAAARAAAVAAAEAALPPHPGDRPVFQGPGAGRLVSPEAWWQHKAAVQQWERQKRQREEGEAEVEAARAGKRRRQAGLPAPLVPGKPLLLPSVALGPAGDCTAGGTAAAKLLAEQRAALAAATAGRGRVRVPRAAAVVGAAKLAAHAAPRGRRGGRSRAAAGSAAAAQDVEEEEQQFLPADMAMLRLQAPLLQQHRSQLHGWGMFAGQAIPRDAFVIEYTGEVIPHSLADQREKRYEAEGTVTMYLFRLDSRSVIDATLKGGAARYINHSCDPNCYTLQLLDIHTGRRCIAIFAGRDIGAGEELTYNYWMEEEPDGEPVPCYCGAPHCTGRMN